VSIYIYIYIFFRVLVYLTAIYLLRTSGLRAIVNVDVKQGCDGHLKALPWNLQAIRINMKH
jgi:hypothetical protein